MNDRDIETRRDSFLENEHQSNLDRDERHREYALEKLNEMGLDDAVHYSGVTDDQIAGMVIDRYEDRIMEALMEEAAEGEYE